VNSNNNSLGTVATPVYKSGYVYANNRSQEYKKNSVYTLTATETSGVFVEWQKNGSQISTNPTVDVTITGDATYTAVFEALGGEQYDIATAVSPAGAGTVAGAGTYYENQTATLTATSANEHLYFFDHWEVGGSTYAGGATITPTVTADATYTAVFRTASNGTITTNTSLPAGGSVIVNQPSTAGGTAVTLTVNVNEGYTFTGWADGGDDNPRTVYVDGDHTYTAQIVEGVTIDVQAALNTNHGFGWGYCFYYWAKAYGYDIMIRAIDNWSWAAGDNMGISDINTSESYINDHGVTVRFTAFTATCYNQNGKKVLDATATGNNGKNYHLILRGVTADSDDTAEAYNQSFTSGQTEIRDGMDNVSDIKWFRAQNGNGQTYSTTWCSHLFFKLDQTQCGTIPSGIYPINDTQQAGTVVSTAGSNNQSYGSYYVQSYLYYVPVTGWVEVVNRDEQYYVYADAYNSRGYDYKTTYGTTPYSVTVSSNSNSYGSAGIVWHSSNCGDVAYGAGTQKFFNGNSITLTTSANSGYEFWRWSDEEASVVNSAYGTSRNVTVSGNLTLLINIGEPASLHNVSITAPENGTITVSYNDGSAQSFTSGSRSIAEGTVLTVTTSPAADYHFNAWTGNGAASVTVNGDKTIGATFAQNDYFLNATYGAGGASVTRDDSGNSETVKRAGNTVTLTPTAATGYNFLAWGGADAAKMSGNVFTFPTNGTHNTTYNVQATFQAITYNISYEGLNGATNSNPETYTIESNDITLVAPGTRTGYTFTGWTCGGNAITQIVLGSTGDKTITANWSQNTYTVTLNANGGASDQTTTATYNSGDLTAWTAPTKSGGTLTGYFTAASEGAKVINADGTLVADVDGYTDASGNWIYDDNATLYAQWEDVPSVLELEDNHISSDAWWTDYDNLRTALGEGTITVRYMRELPADKWCVFALPFGYSFRSGSTLKGCVYELGSAEYTVDGQLTFYFAPVTTKIEANRPYLYRSATGHTNPEFANVQLQAVADGSYSVDNTNTTVGGTVTLRNTTVRTMLAREKSVIYIQNNQLYYPNLAKDTWMRAFRGYFTLDGMAINHIAPRVRIVVEGETTTELEFVQEDGTAVKDNVRKYMENGVLVIERNGVRYDATGARID
jgi:uncharacterized repeat protein (TIGR02543 family)